MVVRSSAACHCCLLVIYYVRSTRFDLSKLLFHITRINLQIWNCQTWTNNLTTQGKPFLSAIFTYVKFDMGKHVNLYKLNASNPLKNSITAKNIFITLDSKTKQFPKVYQSRQIPELTKILVKYYFASLKSKSRPMLC